MRVVMAACVVVVCLVALLAERTAGHITFFSPKEMMLMKEREGRKETEPQLEDGQFQEVARGGNSDETVEIGIRLSPKQLDQVTPVLDKILHEIVEEHEKAKY